MPLLLLLFFRSPLSSQHCCLRNPRFLPHHHPLKTTIAVFELLPVIPTSETTRRRVTMDDLLNWRAKLLDTTRPKHVNDLFILLNTQNNPTGDEDKSVEFRRIAQSVERNIYAGATTKADYLQKLSWRKDSLVYRSGWRAQLRPDSRHRVVLKIMEILSTYVPPEDFEAEDGLRRFSGTFEENAYSEATGMFDYLEKISSTLLHIGQNIRANSEQPNRGDSGHCQRQ